jgi:hypothetical protein
MRLGYEGLNDLKDAGRRSIPELVFLQSKEYSERILYQRSSVHRKLMLVERLCFKINTWHCKHKQKPDQPEILK